MILRLHRVARLSAIVGITGILAAGCSFGPFGPPPPTPTLAGPTDTPTPSPVPPTATVTPTPTATPIPESVIMAEQLSTVSAPVYDPGVWLDTVLKEYLRGTPFPTFAPVANKTYKVGSAERFIVGSASNRVSARLAYQNDVVNFWVENGLPVTSEEAKTAADRFAAEIYPAVRETFGEEWNPGIDDDPRLNILTVFWLGPNIAGAFQPLDEYKAEVYPLSNQKEMFYMSWLAYEVGSDDYLSTLAHEFQHMAQFNNDRNESAWLNEGLSQVAERIAGFDNAFTHHNYLYDSRVQLNTWSRDERESYSHYGAGYLYLLYIREQYGDDTIGAIAKSPFKSLQAVDNALADKGTSADDVFSNWIVANYLNDPSVAEGQFGYNTETLNPVCPRRRMAESRSQPPRSEMKQYSPAYVELEGYGDFTISFTGEKEVSLIPTNPQGGQWFWWSGNAENSAVTLTHEFDLTDKESATLDYLTWHNIEDGDTGVVMASEDSGVTWKFLDATSMQHIEEIKNIGPYYAGGSGGGVENPIWSREKADLSAFAGKKILVRFQYNTDLNASGHGWAVDNVRIAELGYTSNFEEDDGGWVAEGWARVDNKVPQKWAVWLVEYEPAVKVTRLELDGDNAVQTSVTLPPNGRATIIIGAMAPLTQVNAKYSLQIGGTGTMTEINAPPGVLFQDDFENPCGTFTSFILPDYEYGYLDGVFKMRIGIEDTRIQSSAGQEFSNLAMEVDTTFVKPAPGATLGVMCRRVDKRNYYLFEITADGKYMIGAVVDGFYQELYPATEADSIQTGDGAQNHLRVVCDKDTLSLTVNDSVLGTVEDTTFTKGDIGFMASTAPFEGSREAQRELEMVATFDNLVVTRP